MASVSIGMASVSVRYGVVPEFGGFCWAIMLGRDDLLMAPLDGPYPTPEIANAAAVHFIDQQLQAQRKAVTLFSFGYDREAVSRLTDLVRENVEWQQRRPSTTL